MHSIFRNLSGAMIVFVMAILTAAAQQQPVPVPPPKFTPAPTPAPTLTPPAASANATTGTPTISCPQPTFNFGSRDNSETVKHTFMVKNEGTSTLNINRVKPACGCTVANISSKVLAPGESAEITASLNLKGRRGLQTKPMTVYSNDPVKPQFKLTLTGTAVSEIGLSPTAVSMGRLEEGQRVTKNITLTNNGQTPVKITKIESVSNLVSHEIETVEAGKKYIIKVTNNGNIPPGRLSDNLVITTDSAKAPTHRVAVYGTVLDKLSITPNPMILTESNVPVNRVLYVRAGSVKSFQVLNATWEAAGATGRIANLGASGFTVTFQNIRAGLPLNGSKIVITTDVASMPSFEVPVQVRAVNRPGVPTKVTPRPPVQPLSAVSAAVPSLGGTPMILPAKPLPSAPAIPLGPGGR